MLSWKCFRRPLTSNKSSVFLNTEKSLLRSELIPATLTSKNNKAHKNIKVHPLQLDGKKKECIQFFRWKTFEVTEFIVMQLVLYVGKMKREKKKYPLLSPSSTFPRKTEHNTLFESVHSTQKPVINIYMASWLQAINPPHRGMSELRHLPCPQGPLYTCLLWGRDPGPESHVGIAGQRKKLRAFRLTRGRGVFVFPENGRQSSTEGEGSNQAKRQHEDVNPGMSSPARALS